MYKKLGVSILSGAMLLSGAASAMEFDPKFSVGAEATYNSYKLKAGVQQTFANGNKLFKKNGWGANGFINVRLNENFGLEAGYGWMKKHRSTMNAAGTKATTQNRNIFADLLGYMPIDNCTDVIAGVGVGRLQTKTSVAIPAANVAAGGSAKKASYRVRLGVQYKFDDHVAARFMLNHQKGNKLVKHLQSANLGLIYSF